MRKCASAAPSSTSSTCPGAPATRGTPRISSRSDLSGLTCCLTLMGTLRGFPNPPATGSVEHSSSAPTRERHRARGSLLGNLLPVGQELGQAGVGERVLDELLQHRERHGGHV